VFAVQSERGETDAASLMRQPTDGPKIGPPPRPAAAPTAGRQQPSQLARAASCCHAVAITKIDSPGDAAHAAEI
jgi:hypothetical protein